MSTADSANLQTQFGTQLAEIDRIANVTTFNGVNLLSGTAATVNFQVGINATANDQIGVSFGGVGTTALGMGGVDVSTSADSSAAITAIDAAIQTLSTTRAGFGAAMDRMQDTVSNLQSMNTNTSAALSQIQDVDVASATSKLARSRC